MRCHAVEQEAGRDLRDLRSFGREKFTAHGISTPAAARVSSLRCPAVTVIQATPAAGISPGGFFTPVPRAEHLRAIAPVCRASRPITPVPSSGRPQAIAAENRGVSSRMADPTVRTASSVGVSGRLCRPPIGWMPVGGVVGTVVVLLAATSNRYGYHRDELYFRVLGDHPAWGYVDQPPATPLLARLAVTTFGDSAWGLRVPAILCAAVTTVLIALIAREAGGGKVAQAVAAAGATGPFALIFGHILLTNTLDMVVWLTAILFAFRALLHDQPRWWLGVGTAIGAGLYNKHLIILLALAVAAGLAATGPRRVLTSPWLWAGLSLAVLIGLPNVIYQVTHDFPQLKMAQALREHKGHDAVVQLLPVQPVAVGLFLAPVLVAGIIRLLRDDTLRPVRAFAVAYLLLVGALLAVAGQSYYTLGLLLALHAIGSTAAADWVGRRERRQLALAAAAVINATAAVAFALPVFSLTTQARIGIAAINQGTRDQIGWPVYVSQIAAVYRALPSSTPMPVVLIAGNYGEYGAIARYGAADGLPVDRLYSGHNELRNFGGPPETASVAIIVGVDDDGWLASQFRSCIIAGRLDSGYDIYNDEQHRAIQVCREPRTSWRVLWPRFHHLS